MTDKTDEAVAWRWKPADDPDGWRHGGFDPRGYWESLSLVEPLYPASSLSSRDARIAELENKLQQASLALEFYASGGPNGEGGGVAVHALTAIEGGE
jgi:hypothetical protein